MASCSASQTARYLLEGTGTADCLGGGHALLEGSNLELVSGHKGLKVQFAILKRRLGWLRWDVAGNVNLASTLVGRVVGLAFASARPVIAGRRLVRSH